MFHSAAGIIHIVIGNNHFAIVYRNSGNNDNAGASMNPRVLKDAEKKHILDECFPDAAEEVFNNKEKYKLTDRQAAGKPC